MDMSILLVLVCTNVLTTVDDVYKWLDKFERKGVLLQLSEPASFFVWLWLSITKRCRTTIIRCLIPLRRLALQVLLYRQNLVLTLLLVLFSLSILLFHRFYLAVGFQSNLYLKLLHLHPLDRPVSHQATVDHLLLLRRTLVLLARCPATLHHLAHQM